MDKANIFYVRALDCAVSRYNVRSSSDDIADAELEANIGETGIILQNLIGVSVPRKKGQYEIVGGGRRLECVHRNIANGKLGEDFMVPVLVVKTARDAIEMSFAENYYNLPMNPADECRAFQGMIERENKSPAELAKRFGKTERFVLGRLRLANLAEPIFEALRSGEITLDVAKAYAATGDADRQAQVFEQMQASYYGHTVNEIRRQLASGSYKGGDPKALLVGRDAYLAAGGRVETDLFSDSATEIWCDGEMVERLAAEAMTAAASVLREREGFAQVRTVTSCSIPYSETFRMARVEPVSTPFVPEAQARHDEIVARIEEIETEASEAGEYSDEQSDELDALNEEMEALVDASLQLTPDQKAGAIAYLLIDAEGKPHLHHECFAVEPEIDEDSGDDDDGCGEGQAADICGATPVEGGGEAAEPEESYSMRLLDELATMKTELIAVHVANDPRFALDLATFIAADRATCRGWNAMPSELRADAAAPRVQGFVSETAAAQKWADREDALDRSWCEHTDMAGRFDAFCALEDGLRSAWLGWAVARSLHSVPYGQAGSDFLDHLGRALEIDVSTWWRPTARNFFDRLTKPKILDLFEAIGGPELRARHAAARKFDLAVSAERIFAGETVTEAEIKERAMSWLPAPMKFAGISASPVDVCDHDTGQIGAVDQRDEGLSQAA
ncbi:ParB/RepB/Spo0J family partition protein [Novosphingobium lindaniclasticum]